MHGRDLRLPVAVGVAVVAASAATLALRPRSGLIHPAPARPQAYFSPAELDRIHAYVGPQRALGLGGLALTGATLVLLAWRPRRPLRRALERAGARPLVGSAPPGALFEFLAPVVLDPLFNKFTPLPSGRLRTDVLDLAHRSGVHVGQVYRVDASRRTTGENAYVNGLGSTKRMVLYDNLIKENPPAQIRSVVAHELGHVKHHDVPRGLLWLAIVAPAAALLIQRLTERAGAAPARDGRAGPALVPALVLSTAAVAFGVNVAGNVLSRKVEASADAYALQLTHDPGAFIAVQRRLNTTNLSDPTPPGWLVTLFGTHPPAMERI